MDPVLFVRDGDGDVVFFLPNTLKNLNRLRKLAADHVINVAHSHEVMMVYQGSMPNKLPDKFLKNIEPERDTRLLPGGDAREACEDCRFRGQCLGPLRRSAKLTGALTEDASGVLMNMIVEAEIDACPLYTQGRRMPGTVKPAALRALGLEPMSGVRNFCDEVYDDDLEQSRKLNGFKTLDEATELTSSTWVNGVLAESWRQKGTGWRRDIEACHFNELFFTPDLVRANKAKSRIRALNSGAGRRKFNAYRRQYCQHCLYPCKRPPWNMERPNPLTRERVLDEFRPGAEDREWMGVFLIASHKGSYVNPDTGRRRRGIGRRPARLASGDWGMEVVSLVPSYPVIGDLELGEYWRDSGHHGRMDDDFLARYDHGPPRLREDLDEEHLAFLHYALKTLSQWDEVRFYVNDYYPSRNDILAVELYPDCKNIRVHSDTRASGTGGFYGYRGSSISAGDRPRFHTDYSHPYTEAIWYWTYDAPWACGGLPK